MILYPSQIFALFLAILFVFDFFGILPNGAQGS